MSITGLSISSNQFQVQHFASFMIADKAMEQVEAQAQDLVEMLEAAAPVSEGQYIDIRV